MRKVLILLLLFVFVSDVSAAEKSAQKSGNINKIMDNYVAVFDLEVTDGVAKSVSRPLSESIRRELVSTGKYEVIDRGNMNKILGEQKFQMSGCVQGQCIVEAGQLLGVGRIIAGTVSLVGKTYYLSLSLINVESGKIEKVSEDKCKCEIDDLIDSSKRLIKKLMGEKVAEAPAYAETKTETKPEPATTGNTFKDPITGMEFVFVKGGCYQMGDIFGDGESDQKPVHEVCVDDFYMGKYEVTQAQWKTIMGNNPSHFKNCGIFGSGNCPVENISWDDTQEFISKLNQKTGNKYRLPTEAEWEYTARSGGKREKWAGTSDELKLGDYAGYAKNSGNKTHPVGRKKPNGLGIYNMSGNILEWVNDWYDEEYYKNSPRNNPKGPDGGLYRVLRGGAWPATPPGLQTSARYRAIPTRRENFSGFRLVLSAR